MVTETQFMFTVTPMGVLEALGSSLGLWLGIAILQVAKDCVSVLVKIKDKTKGLLSNKIKEPREPQILMVKK